MKQHKIKLSRPRGSAGRKSKTNPGGICRCCGASIYNKEKNSLYCLACAEVRRVVSSATYGAIKFHIKKFKGYKVHVKFNIIKDKWRQ